MFMSADEARELMKQSIEEAKEKKRQSENATRDFAIQKFKEQRVRTAQHILTCAKAGEDECIEFLIYPQNKIDNFIPEIYREEFVKVAKYFFNTLGYQVSFEIYDCKKAWAAMRISWKEQSKDYSFFIYKN